MKKILKMTLLSLVAAVFVSCSAQAQSRNKVRKIEYNSKYNYEVATLAVGVDGTKLVKVWGYGKTPEDAIRHAKELGVACAIFRGFPAATNGLAASTPAITTDDDALEKNQEYFDNFFAPGGKYLQYVNLTTDGVPTDRVRVNKKTYKVGVSMSIAYDELRKEMERQGVARKLNFGF